MTRWIWIVAGMFWLVIAEGASGQEVARVGCFDLEIGGWSPEMQLGADSLLVAPPPRIRLTFEPGKGIGSREQGRSLEAAPGVIPSVHRVRFWEATGDEVSLLWSSGFSGMRMQLYPEGDLLAGTAHTFWDHGREEQEASVEAHPVDCDAPAPEEHRIRYGFSRGVALASGDSIRIGETLPEGVEVARGSGDDFHYRGELEAPFSGAEEVRLWVPDRVVREIRMRLSDERRFEEVVADMVVLYGEPTSRGGFEVQRGELVYDQAGWSARMVRISAHAATVEGEPGPVSVLLQDPQALGSGGR